MTPAWAGGGPDDRLQEMDKAFPAACRGLKPHTTPPFTHTHTHLGCKRAAPPPRPLPTRSPQAYNGNRQRDKELKAWQAAVPDNRTSCPESPLPALVRSNQGSKVATSAAERRLTGGVG